MTSFLQNGLHILSLIGLSISHPGSSFTLLWSWNISTPLITGLLAALRLFSGFPTLSDNRIRLVWGVFYPWVRLPFFPFDQNSNYLRMWRLFFRLLLRHNESAYLFLHAHPIAKTYESAHSVIFIIFASHAQRQQHTGDSISDSSTQKSPTIATIVRNIPSNRTRTSSIGCVECRTINTAPRMKGLFTLILPISNSHK